MLRASRIAMARRVTVGCTRPGRHAQRPCRFRAGQVVHPHMAGGHREKIRQSTSVSSCAHEQINSDDGATTDKTSKTYNSFFNIDPALFRDLMFLSGSQLMLNLGFAQMAPVMPVFASQIGGGLGATGVGLVMAAPSLANFILNMPLGRVCDTVGRKPLMYAGTVMASVGAFLTPFSSSLWTLVPCRLLVGAGICASSTGSSAYMADLTDRAPRHRAKIMGINMSVAGSVWLVGPAIGGWLAETYGMRNSFFIVSVGAALCTTGYTRLPETLKNTSISPDKNQGHVNPGSTTSLRQHFTKWLDDIRPLLESGNQQALVAMSAVPALRFSCFSTVVTHFANSTLGSGPRDIGLMFSALAICQGLATPLGSYLADKTSGAKFAIMLPAGLISCISFATLGTATSLEHFLVAMAMQGMCAGFTVPSLGAYRVEVTPPTKRGQALSLERQFGSIIGLIGPVALGFLADCAGGPAAMLLTSSLMVMCHAVYFFRACPTRA